MKALVYKGPKDIRYESVKDPQILSDDDLIVKTLKCGICGSDLHIYHGHGFTEMPGFCVGHEAVGEVVETGRRVRRFKPGDLVMLPASVGCGCCGHCFAGDPMRCKSGLPIQSQCYGLGGSLQGCQAEAVRVPYGDFNAALIPEGVTIDQALMLTDNLPTAYLACNNAQIGPGSTVAVVGLGPIGLMAVECAFVLGASQVFALDPIAERRASAEKLGAISFEPTTAMEEIREATHGQMVGCAVEAVGANHTIAKAVELIGKGGVVSIVGVATSITCPFPIAEAFLKGITLRIGVCSVPMQWPALVPLIGQGRLHPERFITHELALADGQNAYREYDDRSNGVLKVVLVP